MADAFKPSAEKRRKSSCGVAGSTMPVGRCWFWWETCPAKVKDCELRAHRAAEKGAA